MDMEKAAIATTDRPGYVTPDEEEQTQAIPTPQGDTTQMAMNVECPVCRTPNPPSETYCIDCGFLLSQEGVAVAEISEQHSLGKLLTPDGVREFPLKSGENTVGREDADILLSHNTVSRRHAIVTVEGVNACVQDTGSTNGTYVGGKKLDADEKVDLIDGCDVVFGSFSLKYQAPAEADETPSPGGEGWDEGEERTVSEETPSPGAEGRGEGAKPAEIGETPSPGGEGWGEGAPVGKLVSKDGALTFDIHEGTNTIGRREGDNDIVIPDPYCSGRHADLALEDGRFTITDVGSTNGTAVNGQKLVPNAPRELTAGDEITLGQTPFRLEVA